jgi:hypothetical protein
MIAWMWGWAQVGILMARLHAPWQQVARMLHGPCDAIFSNEEVSASPCTAWSLVVVGGDFARRKVTGSFILPRETEPPWLQGEIGRGGGFCRSSPASCLV